ncbi:zinc finger protein, putative [Plasmodium chabaudi adami]|uniref:Zinc finger protein, putative n=1 Tax=Plasmodium chabaudi adami TaxID=5826 RepID=A0A1C6XD06_PLACE|nr:zinc finger protein, putative [Plasmodium chabaudi adami]
MDIQSNIVNSMILSLKTCKDKNKYILLLNELLSLFPSHAEKSLKLCLKSKIKKYTLIKGKHQNRKYYPHQHFVKLNRERYSKKTDSCFSDGAYNITRKKTKENLSKLKKKKTKINFFIVSGDNQKYIVLKNSCSCFYFKEKVLCDSRDVLCKHILSVILAECFNNYTQFFLDSSIFFEYYLKMMNTETYDKIRNKEM